MNKIEVNNKIEKMLKHLENMNALKISIRNEPLTNNTTVVNNPRLTSTTTRNT